MHNLGIGVPENNRHGSSPGSSFAGRFALGSTFVAFFLAAALAAQTGGHYQSANYPQTTGVIPQGTVLPVRLNQSISSKTTQPGKPISGRIMQEVPLPHGQKIPEGAKVVGRIVAAQPAINGAAGNISLRFDALLVAHQCIPVRTSLRALAGFMDVQEAETPEFSPGFGTPGPWITTRQIGGDEVYGVGGPVTNRWNERVGISVYGGVLVHVRASAGAKCRGALDAEDRAQALWVFSTDACGVYGLEHVQIAHTGRTDPEGTIILRSDTGDVKLRASDALLLRVR